VRAEVDESPTTVGYKIRTAEVRKVPYMAIAGKREVEQQKVSVRKHGTGKVGSMTTTELATHIRRIE
jgi:threonyl-tRNA synthetase